MSVYTDFKTRVLGPPAQRLGSGECVALVVNNSQAYVEALFPGVNWTTIIQPVPDARLMAGKSNQYVQWIANDHNNLNQVPVQGAIMVFDATPQAGYSNTTVNPSGHTGICDSADANGYVLLQQNSPSYGSPANLKQFAWRFRPCLGWYNPLTASMPAPVPPSVPTGKTIFLPPTTGPWHLYNADGPYVPSAAKALLYPSAYGGLTYKIVADKGNGVYVINTQMFGPGALWTKGSDVTIS